MRTLTFLLTACAVLAFGQAQRPARSGPAPAVKPLAISGVHQEHIYDPSLQANAYDVAVPNGWKYDGALVSGTSCTPLPFPVFREYSPDGLTELRRLPRLDWSMTNSRFKQSPHTDCLNLKTDLSASDFLKYLISVNQAAYVREYPIPQPVQDALRNSIAQYNQALAQNARQIDQLNASIPAMAKMPKTEPAVQRGAVAAAVAQYRNGSFTIEEQFFVKLLCTHTPLNTGVEPGSFVETCNAAVRVVRAPQGKLEDALQQVDARALGAAENAVWTNKYLQRMQAEQRDKSEKGFRDFAAKMAASHAEFERQQAVRAQQNQQFIATMEEGTQRALARTQAAAQAREAFTQDWCDLLLDRQTVTGAGGTVKISNAYTYTWTAGDGTYFQTNDINADPNGAIQGNWTKTAVVHGDGSAK